VWVLWCKKKSVFEIFQTKSPSRKLKYFLLQCLKMKAIFFLKKHIEFKGVGGYKSLELFVKKALP
jgi:hypothetical protein